MVLSFQAELVAGTIVKKVGAGYLLSFQINNLLENKQVYARSLPCPRCDEFAVQSTLKALVNFHPQHQNQPQSVKALNPSIQRDQTVKKRRAGEQRRFAEMSFVWVPSGCFQMGSPVDEAGREVEESRHAVCLDEGYWLAETEVTVGQGAS